MKLEREIQRTRATTSDQELRTRLKLLSDSQGSSSSTWAHIHKAAAKPLKFLFKVLTWEETKTVTRPERRNTWEWSRHEEGAHTYTRQHARSSLTGEHVRIGYNLGYSPFYTLEHSTITDNMPESSLETLDMTGCKQLPITCQRHSELTSFCSVCSG